ncbi:MAG: hypothetical protein BZ133_03280 [Methanosphaera sp. SHI613]|jgi:triphosphoribosyl-dephospho-CoA synthase|nr:MAG: hypothetical protein BZ133_03280 [Methanosphaera sp. SHI613]
MNLNSQDIGKLGEMATLFEVSAYPKPGNVHRTYNFDNMSYEDFLISSVCIRGHIEQVADKASKYYPNLLNNIRLGDNILGTIEDTNRLVNTNTNLGIALLFMPIAAACATMGEGTSIKYMPNAVDILMRNTVVDDAIAFVRAILLSKAGGMDNKTSKYDVNNKNTIDEITTNRINLYDLLEMSSKYDKISYELTNKLPVIFNVGFPTYSELTRENPLNDSAVETYLKILSTTNDTLITRKYGIEVAEDISQKAAEILETTEIQTDKRLEALKKFDEYLHENKYNPGTTADFTAASIFVSLIDKYSQSGL